MLRVTVNYIQYNFNITVIKIKLSLKKKNSHSMFILRSKACLGTKFMTSPVMIVLIYIGTHFFFFRKKMFITF